MENEMIERVTDALVLVSDCHFFTRDARWLGTGFEVCRYGADDEDEIVVLSTHPDQAGASMALAIHQARNAAIAALRAMREPTEAMVKAGEAAGGKAYEYTGDTPVCSPVFSWPAMIDAALSPSPVDPR